MREVNRCAYRVVAARDVFYVLVLCMCIAYHLGCSRIARIIQDRVAVVWIRPCGVELVAVGRGAHSRSVRTSF